MNICQYVHKHIERALDLEQEYLGSNTQSHLPAMRA